MDKLKVATLTGSTDRKAQKIISALAMHPEGATPKMLAYLTSINVNTVKSILRNLPGIKKKLRGLYIVENGGDGPQTPIVPKLTDWNFHNCILSSETGTIRNQPHTSTLSLNLINLKFEISTKGHATCRISTDNPLNVSSLEIVAYLFCNWLKKGLDTTFEPNKIMIKSIEFNKDYSNLKLEGVNCLSVDSLTEQFKLYQKKRGLRIEHKTKIPLTVGTVVDMLQNNPNSIDVHAKLQSQAQALERLIEITNKNSSLLMKLLGEMRK